MALGTRVQCDPPSEGPPAGVFPAVAGALHDTIDRGVNYLLSLQDSEGYWLGELEEDTTHDADYIFYLNVIEKAHPDRIANFANYYRRRQLEDAAWSCYYSSTTEPSANVH